MKTVPIIASTLLMLAAASCGGGDDHLSQAKMADVLADMRLAEAIANSQYNLSSDSARNVLRLSVLAKHGITQDDYDRTIDWYAHHLENYAKLNDEVEKRLEKKQKKMLASSTDNSAGDEASMWPYSAMAMISPLASQQNIQFSLPMSELTPGDRLIWRMRLSESVPTQMVLGVDYTDGTTSYTQNRTSQKQLEMTLQSDSTRTVNRVYGYLRVDQHARLPIWADSISLRRMPMANETYYRIQQQNNYTGPRKKILPDTTRKHLTVKPITENAENVPIGKPGIPGNSNNR